MKTIISNNGDIITDIKPINIKTGKNGFKKIENPLIKKIKKVIFLLENQ